jgi:hypothetical protein
MTNPLLLLFVVPVLFGLMLLWVTRRDRRRQNIDQRLHAITGGRDNDEPLPPLTLQRRVRRVASRAVVGKFRVWLDTALEATGNTIGLLHLIILGLVLAIIVILFTNRFWI